ncbi:MAG: SDR family oxidoreductase [Trebonia sp.]
MSRTDAAIPVTKMPSPARVAGAVRVSRYGRIVTAQEVANVIAFLASPKSVAVNGDAIAVGGGAVGPIYY